MTPPRLTAVVCTYWPNRQGNVDRILADLAASSRPPDCTILLNNNPGTSPAHWRAMPGLCLIDSYNTTCRGKFVAALLDVADYYLLLDDDTSVGPTTIATLLEAAHPGICTGYLGCWINRGMQSIHTGARLWPFDAQTVTPCETFCGCAMFMSFKALVRMLMLEAQVRLTGEWPHQGDDILAGLANDSVVVPLPTHASRFVDLGYQGQAMCWNHEDYYGMRDRFTMAVLESLERQPLPAW